MYQYDELPTIRISVGSAAVLGLARGKIDSSPTTVYVLTHKQHKCSASCSFCPQSSISNSRSDLLSRVIWPSFPVKTVVHKIGKAFNNQSIQRVCLQALNYPKVFEDIKKIARRITESSRVPISVSCQPLVIQDIMELNDIGVDRLSIALDAATKKIFDSVKGIGVNGPYTWEGQWKGLGDAVKVFGRGNVSTHLIVGLGETEEEMVRTIQECFDLGVCPGLFAFTPISGTPMEHKEPPSLATYRRIQIARQLISKKTRCKKDMKFRDGRIINFGLSDLELRKIIRAGKSFKTSGCPGCNRPYYNERPSGPVFNYSRCPSVAEIKSIEKTLCLC